MIDINKAITVRLKINKENFEILATDTEKAIKFREGKLQLDDVLVTDDIFTDVKRGLHANEHEMKSLFSTIDKRKIAEIILKQGEIQLTAEYLNKVREEKRKQIINLIHRNSIDPKTNLPHPPQRIENAFLEAKINIDANRGAEEQVQDIIRKLSSILPIRYEIRELRIKIPPQFAGQSFSILKHYGKLLNETWNNDGSLTADLEVPAGLQSDLFNELNHLTKGNVETQVIKSK